MIRMLRFGCMLLLALASAVPLRAADFQVVEWRGADVLLMTGRIDAGTADRFASAAPLVRPMAHGLPVLLLNSTGGDVNEAMRMAALMDQTPFHTVIFNGARCASACGSVIFLAGAARTVDPGGLLGQHSCASRGRPNPACNERMAEFALRYGVSHGSINAFVTSVPPEEILWFGREDADGWGLTRYPGESSVPWQHSEPRVDLALFGAAQPVQDHWRIDFRADGYEAFLRNIRDDLRQMEMNLFCDAAHPDLIFFSLELPGGIGGLRATTHSAALVLDGTEHPEPAPRFLELDEEFSEVILSFPRARLDEILTGRKLAFRLEAAPEKRIEPLLLEVPLAGSRDNLAFAAGACMGRSD